MTTTADEKLQEAKDHMKDAYKCLLEVLDPDCYGHDEYEEKYMERVQEALCLLSQVMKKV